MKASIRTGLLAFASALASCGGFTDGGDGSHTLAVDARASFEAGNGSMDVRVSVDKSSAHVAGAIVTVRDDASNAVFTLDDTGNSYRANIAGGYRRRLQLDISSGSDKLTAKLEGPGPHFVSKPFEDQTIKLGGDPLTVEWAVSDGIRAQGVAVSLDGSDYRGETTHDDGSVDIPRELLRAGDDTIHVERTNDVVLDGATPGSTFVMSYEASSHVHFID